MLGVWKYEYPRIVHTVCDITLFGCVNIPPRYSISDVMGRMKSQSSSRMRKKFKWLRKVYWKENILWSTGYFVSSVGVDEETIKNYVERRGCQDSGQLREEL